MRRNIATTLAILSLPLGANLALAKGPVPEGATATVNITLAVKEQTKSQWSSTAVDRVLKAQCVMIAGPATQIGWNGPTAEQEAAIAKGQANAEAFQQNYAPSDNMMANMEAMMEKCGEDEACIQAEVMKMSQTPEVQGMVAKQEQAKKDVAGLTPDLGPARYQSWSPQSCSGTLTVNDTYFTSDPGGEGGDGAFQDTTTVAGSTPIDPKDLAVMIETDSIGKTTSYKIGAPIQGTFPGNSSMKGAANYKIPLMGSTALPPVIGPLKGVLGKQSTKIPGQDGAISLQIQAK